MALRLVVCASLVVVSSASCGGSAAPDSSLSQASSTQPAVATTSISIAPLPTGESASTRPEDSAAPGTITTTTTSPTTSPPGATGAPVGRIEGVVAGWPPDAVGCSAEVTAWGPWPYRRTSVACDPVDPSAGVAFSFDIVPAGEWGMRVVLRWTGTDGSLHGRFSDFPPAGGWYRVAEGETTSVRLVADRPGGALTGLVLDDGNGLPISGQFEPGAPMVNLVAFDRSGRIVGGGGNDCDGGYTMWVPAGYVAVAAIVEGWNTPQAVWRSEWAVSDDEFDPASIRFDSEVAIDPALIPGGAWVGVGDGEIVGVDFGLGPGEGWDETGGWFPWWVAPIHGEPLPEDSPWRDPGFWIGRAVAVSPEDDGWPPPLVFDGEDLGLRGDDARQSGRPWVIARPASPPGASGAGGEPAFFPAYALLMAVGADGVVVDARHVDVEPGGFLSMYGFAPHDQETAYAALLGAGPTRCVIADGPAVRAWKVADGSIVEVDPAGISVEPYG